MRAWEWRVCMFKCAPDAFSCLLDSRIRQSDDHKSPETRRYIRFNLNWKCASKGKDLEIVDVYGTFLSVVLGQGENSVSCRYRPKWADSFWGKRLVSDGNVRLWSPARPTEEFAYA